MVITDDGNRFVVDSRPWLIGKFFAVVFAFLAISFPAMAILSLVLPQNEVGIVCNRARGTCEVARTSGAGRFRKHETVRIADIEHAEVVRNPYRSNESTSYSAVLRTRGGETIKLTDAGYRDEVIDSYRRAVGELDGFLGDPTRAAFATRFVSGDTDWITIILFSLLAPIMAWIFFGFWVTRHTELDRAARTVRVVTTRKLRGTKDRTIPFSEINGVRATGYRWLYISVVTPDGPEVIALLPRWPSMRGHARRVLETLGKELGMAPNVDAQVRKIWGLD